MLPEFELIDEIRRAFPVPEGVDVGIGDDAAVLSRQFDVVTTDMLVEGVHFRFDWCSPEDVGWKSLVASLSDVAAMGATPGPFVVGIGLGPDHDESVARGLVEGLRRACQAAGRERVAPVGGDLSSTPGPAVVSVTLFGESEGPGAIGRGGASVGDRLVLFGAAGRSAAGLAALERWGGEAADRLPGVVEAHCRPTAQMAAGAGLGRERLASALIDVSDGLIRDLGHILDQSGVGARLEVDALRLDDDLVEAADVLSADPVDFVLGGGEDFSLLAAVPRREVDALRQLAGDAGWPMSVIGAIVDPDEGLSVVEPSGERRTIASGGYEHFRAGP
jgi:thiamine-monophosphate kinase